MASSRLLRSPARNCSDCDVKKLLGLSRAVLTFLPVASRFWVTLIRSAVFCNESRFCRTPGERTMSLMAQSSIREPATQCDRRDNGAVTLMSGKNETNGSLTARDRQAGQWVRDAQKQNGGARGPAVSV